MTFHILQLVSHKCLNLWIRFPLVTPVFTSTSGQSIVLRGCWLETAPWFTGTRSCSFWSGALFCDSPSLGPWTKLQDAGQIRWWRQRVWEEPVVSRHCRARWVWPSLELLCTTPSSASPILLSARISPTMLDLCHDIGPLIPVSTCSTCVRGSALSSSVNKLAGLLSN
jgi:hypothetical protein